MPFLVLRSFSHSLSTLNQDSTPRAALFLFLRWTRAHLPSRVLFHAPLHRDLAPTRVFSSLNVRVLAAHGAFLKCRRVRFTAALGFSWVSSSTLSRDPRVLTRRPPVFCSFPRARECQMLCLEVVASYIKSRMWLLLAFYNCRSVRRARVVKEGKVFYCCTLYFNKLFRG